MLCPHLARVNAATAKMLTGVSGSLVDDLFGARSEGSQNWEGT